MKRASFLIKPASGACNMRCKYCFYADVINVREIKNYGMMTVDTLEILVKKALSQVEETVSFAFQGGEPTLVGLEFYKKFIELQKKHNSNKVKILNSIQTNGYIINEEWARFLAENRFLVGLSLDGPKEINDRYRLDNNQNSVFDKVMAAAKLFDQYYVQYNILCVVNRFVAFNAKRVYDFFKEQCFRYLQFIPCLDGFKSGESEFSLSHKQYADFLKVTFDEYFKDFFSNNYISVRHFDNYVHMLLDAPPESCDLNGVCSSYFVVEGDGSVYPCDFYVLDDYTLGNILTHDLEEMIKSEKAEWFYKSSTHVDEKCKVCKHFTLCRGGCRRNRESLTDGRLQLNKYCEAYREFFVYATPKLLKIASAVSRNAQK